MSAPDDNQPFAGFGIVPHMQAQDGVFILAVYRDGSLSATAHATERGAMEAAVEYLEGELADEEEGGALDDQFVRVQRYLADDGGLLEIIPSAIHGS